MLAWICVAVSAPMGTAMLPALHCAPSTENISSPKWMLGFWSVIWFTAAFAASHFFTPLTFSFMLLEVSRTIIRFAPTPVEVKVSPH